jgi:hypothetical protein
VPRPGLSELELPGVEPLLTSAEAFEAMRIFLAQFNEREPAEQRETIQNLLSWTEIQTDGGTFDPAQSVDWERSVAAVVRRRTGPGEGATL